MRYANRIIGYRLMPAAALRPHPFVWRVHPDSQIALIVALLEQIGWIEPILIYWSVAADGYLVVNGHARLALDDELPCLLLNISDGEAERQLLNQDVTALSARVDRRALERLRERVTALATQAAAQDEALRHTTARLDNAAKQPVQVALEPAPRPQPSRVLAPGSIVQMCQHRMLVGDATNSAAVQRLAAGYNVNCLLTDSPWGVRLQGRTAAALTIANDTPDQAVAVLSGALQAARTILQAGSPFFIVHPSNRLSVPMLMAMHEAGFEERQILVLVKNRFVVGHAEYHNQAEFVAFGYLPDDEPVGRCRKNWYGGNNRSTVLEMEVPTRSDQHPTAKPPDVIERLLRDVCGYDGVVYDAFLGSGSTLIAAEQYGIRCIGCEIDTDYAARIVDRWEAETGQRAEVVDMVEVV